MMNSSDLSESKRNIIDGILGVKNSIELKEEKIKEVRENLDREEHVLKFKRMIFDDLKDSVFWTHGFNNYIKRENIDKIELTKHEVEIIRDDTISLVSAFLGLLNPEIKKKDEEIKELKTQIKTLLSVNNYEELKVFKEQMGKGRPKKEIDIELVKDLKKKGYSVRKIALLLEVSESCLRARLKEK